MKITPLVQRQVEKEEEILQTKEASGHTPEVTPNFESQINSLRGGGQPLPEPVRDFFEPRFGYDFSHVRVHTSNDAVQMSRELNAEAFTHGRDVYFGAGRYSPGTSSGKRFLAHELTHVVQQRGGYSAGLLIQKAKIPYTHLTWGDFKGTATAKSKRAAETATEINLPGWKPTREVADTGTECKMGKKTSKEFKVELTIDPSIFDSVIALMVQEKSWVKDWPKDNGHAKCIGQGKECEGHFDKSFKKIETDCKKSVKECKKAFDNGSAFFPITFDGGKVEVTSKGECETKLLTECKELSNKRVSYSSSTEAGVKIAEAKEKKECKKEFFEQCVKFYKSESEKLLKHEQGHFDIANVMAQKVQKALKDKVATLKVEETKCGKVEAINAAVKSFNSLKAGDVLKKIFKVWNGHKKNAQKYYDDETDHGLNEAEQKAWEGKIAKGLSDYEVSSD